MLDIRKDVFANRVVKIWNSLQFLVLTALQLIHLRHIYLELELETCTNIVCC